MKSHSQGQVLPIVMATMMFILIVITALVSWMQYDSKWAVKDQKTTSAINLAQGGIDRACWKLQSSTTTWSSAAAGAVLTGFNFDTTYTDMPGGSYRIKISSGPSSGGSCTTSANCVTIIAEGRDTSTQEVRAISTVYVNQTIYSGLMAQGNVTWSPGLGLFWGPIIAQGNITLLSGIDAWYFPKKYAKGNVVGTAAHPRDVTYPLPPNTDGVEWWANYPGVPPLPLLDFAAMRAAAAASGTLNVYGCQGTGAAWDLNASCNGPSPHNTHFGDSTNYILTHGLNPNQNYIWYWDGDVTLTGKFNGSNQPYTPGRSTALKGTIIVRGNLTLDSPGDFVYTGHVPANAWQQENELTSGAFDTAATNQYPADTGYHSSASTFGFGYTYPTFCVPLATCNEYATVGLRGLVYVGGNLTILSYMDIHGSLWVNGNVNASGGSYSQFTSVFYDDTLQVPALNVILLRQSWQEIAPSRTAWN